MDFFAGFAMQTYQQAYLGRYSAIAWIKDYFFRKQEKQHFQSPPKYIDRRLVKMNNRDSKGEGELSGIGKNSNSSSWDRPTRLR